MAVITLTLNPAFDVHCDCRGFQEKRENRAKITHKDAGGKGINLSRALNVLGTENLAIAVLGDENREEFLKKLWEQGFSCEAISVPGKIRENLTLHDGAEETRISFDGFSVESSILDQIEERLEKLPINSIVTLTGSLPEGLEKEKVMALITRRKQLLWVVDCSSFSMDELLELKPWIIKPNEEEICRYMSKEDPGEEEMIAWAENVQKAGVSNVVISLGARGAYMISGTGVYHVMPPRINAVSTIGAGDSMLAGLITAYLDGGDGNGCLSLAVACGTAACLTEGTEPPRKKDIDKILKKVSVL